VQGELGTLAHAPAEDADPGHHQQPVSVTRPPAIRAAAAPGLDARGDGLLDLVRLRFRAQFAHDPSHLVAGGQPHQAIRRPERIVRPRANQAEDPLLDVLDAVGVHPRQVAKRERAQSAPQGHQADEHAKVAHAVDDERLVRRLTRARPLDVEPDQKVRTDAYQFPEHKHHRDVAGQHQSQHAEAEQRQVLKEPHVTSPPPQRQPVP